MKISKKILFTVWSIIILAIMLAIFVGAWWINRDPVLLLLVGLVIALVVFLSKTIALPDSEESKKGDKE